MAHPRKDKQAFLGKNLFHLRKKKGKTLEEMAELLDLNSKSSYKAYEEDKALPDIHKVMKLASFFDVAIAQLMYQDLTIIGELPKFDERRLFEVAKVPIAAAAGYSKGFNDDGYMSHLKTIKIPFEPYGIARAFEIEGDSMEPEIKDGSTVVGIRVSNSTIRDNKPYIVVTRDGVQCKNVRYDRFSDFIYLISNNTKYLPKHVSKDEVLEMWEIWKVI